MWGASENGSSELRFVSKIRMYIPVFLVMNECTNFLDVSFSLFCLEYITKTCVTSRIRFFQGILKILLNRWKDLSSKVPPYDVIDINCVSRPGVDCFVPKFHKINYLKFILRNRPWHVKWGHIRKIYQYLGVQELTEKSLKSVCKGFDKIENEAKSSNQGYCCQGQLLAGLYIIRCLLWTMGLDFM